MPIEILMPALSPTMTEGNLATWLKKEGDKVSAGEVIAEIETDKATMEVEAVDDGILGKIFVTAGSQDVKVNSVIAIMLAEDEDKSALKDYKLPEPAVTEKPKEAAPKKETTSPAQTPSFSPAPQVIIPAAPTISKPSFAPASLSGRVKASPLAKRLAGEAGLDLSQVQGTGPHGRIIKNDVELAIKTGGGVRRAVRNPVEYTAVANDTMRKVIAQRLLQSKQHVPHFYLNIDCNIDKLLEARIDINESANIDAEGNTSFKLSVNDMIIKAVALALKKVPEANATWTDEAILLYNNVDISVAVAIDGGLITPIVRNADQKELPSISMEMKDLAARAKKGKLAPEEFQGGGFSISNLGMFGVKNFNAIINPPQGCILAVGAGEKRAIVKGDKIEVATVMTVTLSCDHRVVDGAVGAQFLAAFKDFIEKPITMLL